MKEKLKLFGIIALALIIGFSIVSCGGGKDDPLIDPDGPGTDPEDPENPVNKEPVAITMVDIAGGTFTRSDSETITVGAFKMAEVVITQGIWKEVMGTDLLDMSETQGTWQRSLTSQNWSYQVPAEDAPIANPGTSVNNSHPMEIVSWFDAIEFCNILSIRNGLDPVYYVGTSADTKTWGTKPDDGLTTGAAMGHWDEYEMWPDSKWNTVTMDLSKNGYRLPTEAEWEYAARGGQNFKYAGSDTANDVAVNNRTDAANDESNGPNSGSHGMALDNKTKTANGFGLFDMSGQVFEWCWDWAADYDDTELNNPKGPSESSASSDDGLNGNNLVGKILRGGAYNIDFVANDGWGSVSWRYAEPPATRKWTSGFRLVCAAE